MVSTPFDQKESTDERCKRNQAKAPESYSYVVPSSVSEDALLSSLERFKAISERLAHIVGANVDGWDPAQKALQKAFPGIMLAECHLHAMIKLGQHLATFKRQRKAMGQPVSEQEETQIRTAFVRVLQAPTPASRGWSANDKHIIQDDVQTGTSKSVLAIQPETRNQMAEPPHLHRVDGSVTNW